MEEDIDIKKVERTLEEKLVILNKRLLKWENMALPDKPSKPELLQFAKDTHEFFIIKENKNSRIEEIKKRIKKIGKKINEQ